MMDDEINGIFYVNESLVQDCEEYYFSSLVNDTVQNIIKIFGNCDNKPKKYEITKISEELPSTVTEPLSPTISDYSTYIPTDWTKIFIDNNYLSFVTSTNLLSSINDFEIGKYYLIYGKDYIIKISPTNHTEYKKNYSYIDFSVCEDKLRKYLNISDSRYLTIFQIEIFDDNPKSLTNQLEYAIFDDSKNVLNLSICSNEKTKIYYNITNSSVVNIPIISQFSQIGVDLFNIKDKFFNDICYPYSERGSDVILEDRIKDFYQHYSLCDTNCEYDHIDLENMKIVCNCFFKGIIKVEKEKRLFNKIIFDIAESSTFWVVKCYKLVFTLNKKNNIGFWVFLFLFLFRLPFIIHYFKYQDKIIKNEIKIELNNINKIDNQVDKESKNNKSNNKNNNNQLILRINNKKNNIENQEQKSEISSRNKLNNDNISSSSITKLNEISTKQKNKSLIIKEEEANIQNSNNKHLSVKNNNLITMNNNDSNDIENKNTIINKNNNFIFNHIIKIPDDNKILKYNLYYNAYDDALKYEDRSFFTNIPGNDFFERKKY